jgi:hypothetical protein
VELFAYSRIISSNNEAVKLGLNWSGYRACCSGEEKGGRIYPHSEGLKMILKRKPSMIEEIDSSIEEI